MSDNKKNKKNNGVYLPPDTVINFKNEELPPPTTEYDNRQEAFDREAVENMIKNKRKP